MAFTRLSAAGGLKRYGASPGESARQKSARPVDRLSNGADPATLPVEPLTRFELVLDVTTAQAMRLSFPPDLRDLADRVIKRRLWHCRAGAVRLGLMAEPGPRPR